ncbi:hypothetical protein [Pseudonocardia kongjuensis]|uniref:hypothetical protein n=1 Tax=Pseudonocardia kongjuensis TaxID=102227 RepID=UPI0031D8F2FF
MTVIVAALTAGAVAGAQGTAATAVGELYSGLKALIASRFRGKPAAEAALRKFETDRETWKPVLEAELVRSRVDVDEQVVAAARRLMEVHDPSGAQAGKYRIDLRGAQGVLAGDHNVQHVTFTTPAPQQRDTPPQ